MNGLIQRGAWQSKETNTAPSIETESGEIILLEVTGSLEVE